jgi:hypothetical protein
MTDPPARKTPGVREVLAALDDWCEEQARVTRQLYRQAEVEREKQEHDQPGSSVTRE